MRILKEIKDVFNYSSMERTGIVVLLVLIYFAVIIPGLYSHYKDENNSLDSVSDFYIVPADDFLSNDIISGTIGNSLIKKCVYSDSLKTDSNKLESSTQKKDIVFKRKQKSINPKIKTFGKNSFKKSLKHSCISQEGKSFSLKMSKKFNNRRYNVRIELNSSDTTELKKVYGIGSWYSRKIIRYRERLGGFFSVTQLREIKMRKGVYERISPQLYVDTTYIKKINLDTIGFRNLLRHPYFDYDMVKKVFTLRKRDSHITAKDLLENEIVNLLQYNKIKRYSDI